MSPRHGERFIVWYCLGVFGFGVKKCHASQQEFHQPICCINNANYLVPDFVASQLGDADGLCWTPCQAPQATSTPGSWDPFESGRASRSRRSCESFGTCTSNDALEDWLTGSTSKRRSLLFPAFRTFFDLFLPSFFGSESVKAHLRSLRSNRQLLPWVLLPGMPLEEVSLASTLLELGSYD